MSEPQKNNVPNTSSSGSNNAALSGNPNGPAADLTGTAMQNNAPDAAIPVNNTPPNSGGNNPHNSVDAGTVQFSSAMTAKAEQPKDYFAEQNAKQAEKNQASAKARKRLLIILGAVIGVVVVALVAWLVVWLMRGDDVPTIANGTTEEIVDLRKVAQAAYEKNNNSNDSVPVTGEDNSNTDMAAAESVFDQALSSSSGSRYTNQILLSKMMFYFNNGYIDLALSMMNQIDVNALPLEQQAIFYDLASTAFSENGDAEAANNYWLLSYQISRELGNGGGGGE